MFRWISIAALLLATPVAARDIPMGTKIPPKDLEQFFVLKKFPRENLPPTAVQTLEAQDVARARALQYAALNVPESFGEVTATGDVIFVYARFASEVLRFAWACFTVVWATASCASCDIRPNLN